MRKTLITLAAAASALAVATPAAAQYYPAPAYSAPYGNAYGYRYGGNQWARELQDIRYQADMLSRQGRLTRSESRDLYRDIQSMERAIYNKGRRGVSRHEGRQLNNKLARIRYELRRYSDRDGRYRNRYWR